MSSHNWKFDYRVSPWERLMDKTGANLENVGEGHYRKPSAQRLQLEKKLDLSDVIVNALPDRCPGNLTDPNQYYFTDSRKAAKAYKTNKIRQRRY